MAEFNPDLNEQASVMEAAALTVPDASWLAELQDAF